MKISKTTKKSFKSKIQEQVNWTKLLLLLFLGFVQLGPAMMHELKPCQSETQSTGILVETKLSVKIPSSKYQEDHVVTILKTCPINFQNKQMETGKRMEYRFVISIKETLYYTTVF